MSCHHIQGTHAGACLKCDIDRANVFISDLKREHSNLLDTVQYMFDIIYECDKYLDTNNLTSIGHGSILHRKMKEIISTEREKRQQHHKTCLCNICVEAYRDLT